MYHLIVQLDIMEYKKQEQINHQQQLQLELDMIMDFHNMDVLIIILY